MYVIIPDNIPCIVLKSTNFFKLYFISFRVEYIWQIIQKPLNPSIMDINTIFAFKSSKVGDILYISKEPLVTSNMPDSIFKYIGDILYGKNS